MNEKELRKLIKDLNNYEAHTRKNKNEEIIGRESLEGHTSLTVKYFSVLWKEKAVSKMLEKFCVRIGNGRISESGKIFLKEIVYGVPVFHDIGKINPEFQRKCLKNDKIEIQADFSGIGSRHSVVSAVIYLDYFLNRLKEQDLPVEEKKRIRPLIVFMAYIIDRHHSGLDDFELFENRMDAGDISYVIGLFERGECPAYQAEFRFACKKVKSIKKLCNKFMDELTKTQSIDLYLFIKMIYSLLVASDYYATAEFIGGTEIHQFGNIDEIQNWVDVYEHTSLMKTIREYQRTIYPKSEEAFKKEKNINCLRTEMLLDAEQILVSHPDESFFYLEAPTGSGKSNTAINLSLRMTQMDRYLKKIYYIYPFNTLVEQNIESLKKIFGENERIFNHIAVVNSLTPIKVNEKMAETEPDVYQKALLDRQFLNYPMILSTHVSLFNTIFGDTKESVFGFHQLINSVIVLDEIQSYKNILWGEIIYFLKELSDLMHVKVIIMSATLPNLDLLAQGLEKAVMLMKDRQKYFAHACFKKRVKVSYELMDKGNIIEELITHIKSHIPEKKKILVEFIKRNSAAGFYQRVLKEDDITCDIEYMSGEDNIVERRRILTKVKEDKPVILIATQVVEAGIDIDMDIGYKNIAMLDSEEQFMGRINRSCMKQGKVYFFKLDDGKRIYGEDIRIQKEFTLENEWPREILIEKNFDKYYRKIMSVLRKNYNEQLSENGLDTFFHNYVGGLSWKKVKERMELIPEEYWKMPVFLARKIKDENGNLIDGVRVWEDYVILLEDFNMDYAEKRIKLSRIMNQMNYFIYQITRNNSLSYNDKVGEILYIEDGEKYFENGKLNHQKLMEKPGEFVDFI